MLIWINGPFGGGKTHVASELSHRLPGSWVADPELVGFGLHRMMPPVARQDFQDLPAWRKGVYEALDRTLRLHKGVVLAPMTLVDPDYFAEIIGHLRGDAHDVRHFALLAKPETVRSRLRDRGFGRLTSAFGMDPLKFETFALDRLDRYLSVLQQPAFAEHVWTDEMSIPEVAEKIAASAGLTLRPRDRSRVRSSLRRTWTTVRHLRIM